MSENLDAGPGEIYTPVNINLRSLMDAGAHFGHQTQRWNPKMLPMIYGARNNVHIINLDLTLKAWERARKFIVDITSRGGSVLFVGTKLQVRDHVKATAERCGAFYVTERWLGGTLSNFQTIKRSIEMMRKLEDLLNQAADPSTEINLKKKERVAIGKQLEKLSANLGGIRTMKRTPDLIFVVDIIKEDIAVKESRRLKIPVIALLDTNCDPDQVDFGIPSNDDATKTVRLFLDAVADAVLEGSQSYQMRRAKEDDKNVAATAKDAPAEPVAASA